MINILFRMLLSFNATSLLIIIFLVQKGITLDKLLCCVNGFEWVCALSDSFSYIFYLAMPVLLTGFSIWLCKFLGKDEFKTGEVVSIKHENNIFLFNYLGLFFVALSVDNLQVFYFVYFMFFAFTFICCAWHLNPILLLFGYKIYSITTKNGTALLLISKKMYKNPNDIQIASAFRLGNCVFIER